MTWLVDTNVWSELRKRERADARVRRWAAQVSEGELFLSVVTLLELEYGVLLMERRDPAQGARLRDWLERKVVAPLERQILPVTAAIARRAAAFHVPDPRPEADAMIAATAAVHGLTLATRNTADFRPLGVPLFDPWAAG